MSGTTSVYWSFPGIQLGRGGLRFLVWTWDTTGSIDSSMVCGYPAKRTAIISIHLL